MQSGQYKIYFFLLISHAPKELSELVYDYITFIMSNMKYYNFQDKSCTERLKKN